MITPSYNTPDTILKSIRTYVLLNPTICLVRPSQECNSQHFNPRVIGLQLYQPLAVIDRYFYNRIVIPNVSMLELYIFLWYFYILMGDLSICLQTFPFKVRYNAGSGDFEEIVSHSRSDVSLITSEVSLVGLSTKNCTTVVSDCTHLYTMYPYVRILIHKWISAYVCTYYVHICKF